MAEVCWEDDFEEFCLFNLMQRQYHHNFFVYINSTIDCTDMYI